MSQEQPCGICQGLGFRSLDDRQLDPAFNVWGLTRRIHSNGRVTWEGDCATCRSTGIALKSPEPQQGYWARLNPFGYQPR